MIAVIIITIISYYLYSLHLLPVPFVIYFLPYFHVSGGAYPPLSPLFLPLPPPPPARPYFTLPTLRRSSMGRNFTLSSVAKFKIMVGVHKPPCMFPVWSWVKSSDGLAEPIGTHRYCRTYQRFCTPIWKASSSWCYFMNRFVIPVILSSDFCIMNVKNTYENAVNVLYGLGK